MIAYSYIESNLRSLNTSYRRSKSIAQANYSSKIAILELCGWIELSMDDSIRTAGNRLLRLKSSNTFLENKIKRNYGFEYENHFKSMIVNLIGIFGFEKIEASIDRKTIILFENELNALKLLRNRLAHSYTRGATVNYDAPSITISRFENVKVGLQAYDTKLRQYSL